MLRSVQNKRKVNTEKVKSWKMNFTKKFFCENQKGTKKSICQFSLEKDFVKKVKQKFCFKFENKPFWRDRIKATYCQKSSLQLLKIYFSFVSLKIGQLWPPFFVYFCSVKHKFYKKTVDFSEFWTRIIGVEGKHADHLTTTTALNNIPTYTTWWAHKLRPHRLVRRRFLSMVRDCGSSLVGSL